MMTLQFRTGDPYHAQSTCPCCHQNRARIVATRDGKTGAALTTIACDTCGLGRTDPLPSTEALTQWYAQSYRQEYKSAFQPALRHVLRAGRIALDRWAWLQSHGFVQPGSATLDIGASSGEFVYLMKHLGFAAQGLEPHEGYAGYARQQLQLDVRQGNVHDMASLDQTQRWDLVSLFHVFEHLSDPLGSLQAIAQVMSDSGVLFIEVPNATRPCSPHYMFFKAHVLYFTGETLRQTLQAAGWQVLAHNADDEGNLRVLARPGTRAHAPAWPAHGHALVRAQQARRWGPYLLGEMFNGRVLQRLRTRREEKRRAARYGSGRDLLEALYASAALTQAPSAAAGPPDSALRRSPAGD
jgi:2-polyprenyl-3-methyl-5-hydroxy-6-metoxy-1,4-benzoquinol methylase